MTPTHIIGVDPGISGAIALYNIQTRRIDVFDMPVTAGRVDPGRLATIVEMCKLPGDVTAVVELVSSLPRQAGAFNFGVSAGIVHGVLGALNVPFTLVQPAQWKGAMGLRRLPSETQAQNKTRARELAIKLWPESADLFKRIKDDGRAEAALLARYFVNVKGWER